MQPVDLIYRAAARHPEAVAVEAPGISLDYRELVTRADALAVALQAIDPEPQTRVGVCAYNTVEHLTALLAVMAADKVWVPLNPLDARRDLDTKVAAARPSTVIIDEACLDKFDPGSATILIGARHSDAMKADAQTIDDLITRYRGERPRRRGLPAALTQAIKFTGGSSGKPKGVLQPYRAWTAGASSMVHAFGFGPADRYLVAAPLTHGTSCYVTPLLAVGGTLVFMQGKTTPEKVLDAFREQNITVSFLPPTLIYMMMQAMEQTPRNFEQLRLLIYGAAIMPPEKIREARDMFGPVIATNYGLTEAPQIITALTPEETSDESTIASVGTASFMTRVGIVSAAGELLRAGEQGEIVVSGDLLMSGYLDNAEQTAEALVDGWLHTGDVGYLDDRGFLFLKDRLKDVIISGGFNVYPSDVEAALVAHPAIHECVVFGCPDEKWGEAVQVAVALREGAAASAEDIIAFAKQQVGSVQAPKQVHFLDSLPRSAVGKVQRREVRALTERSEER
ncbi:MAG: long-chain fatty acid--CoA ligase [Gammaproteobacteria bacterium]|nr:MAG: long-chain fatty acid--CoA ligase [Gammaproteobacteria bacterium]